MKVKKLLRFAIALESSVAIVANSINLRESSTLFLSETQQTRTNDCSQALTPTNSSEKTHYNKYLWWCLIILR